MDCQLCGNQITRKFDAFMPIEGKEDEKLEICAQCHLLIEIHDRLKELVDRGSNSKAQAFTPLMQSVPGQSPLPIAIKKKDGST